MHLKGLPFGFCSVQVMPLFRSSFCLFRRCDKNLAFSSLRLFWDLDRFEANLYTSQPPGLEIAVILSLFWKVETANQVQVVNMSKKVGKDRVFLGLAGMLLRTSLGICPRELPQSSSVNPRKTLIVPPLLLKLTQYQIIFNPQNIQCEPKTNTSSNYIYFLKKVKLPVGTLFFKTLTNANMQHWIVQPPCLLQIKQS